ncbi:MAG: BrnT family toxin [Micropepsaceae bacterium]
MYQWDEAKRQENLRKHGVDFSIVEAFEWEAAIIFEDSRERYDEQRWVAFGPIGSKLFALVVTVRDEDVTRVISLREATKRERKLYVQEI